MQCNYWLWRRPNESGGDDNEVLVVGQALSMGPYVWQLDCRQRSQYMCTKKELFGKYDVFQKVTVGDGCVQKLIGRHTIGL